MRLFNNIRNYIGENEYKIIISNNSINIINYLDIKELNENKVILITDRTIIITGKNLKANKLLNNEILINGDISQITINE
jgi:hypothetical protein